MRGLMHMAGGMRGETLNLEEFVAQAEEYREGGELLDSVYKVLNVLGLTHPFAVVRVAELKDWIDGGTYERILAGEYAERGTEDERPYREDLAEALSGYKDSAQKILDEVDAAVDRMRDRVSKAWRGSSDS